MTEQSPTSMPSTTFTAEYVPIHVRLTKLSAHNTPEGALPTPYWLKGHLLSPLEIGWPIKVWRYVRAAQSAGEPDTVSCFGSFTSSPVVQIEEAESGQIITTQNSVWRIEQLPAMSLPVPTAATMSDAAMSTPFHPL